MFYEINQAVNLCLDDNSLIFKLIKDDEKEVVGRILENKSFDINICDDNGNSLIMRLLISI